MEGAMVMIRVFTVDTAMTAAADHAADHSACAVMMFSRILDAILLASIFVALLRLCGLISLIILFGLLLTLAICPAERRLKDQRPAFA